MFNVPPATLWTCGLLIAIYAVYSLLGPVSQDQIIETLAFVPAIFLNQFATGGPGLSLHEMLTLVSHAFLHAGLLHLVLNTGFLLAFGSGVERHLGVWRFVLIFVVTSAAGALTEALIAGPRPVYLIGASGAVYGMMGAIVPVLMRTGRLRGRRSLEFIGIILVLNLLLAVFGMGDYLGGGQIAWLAHIGGFLAGLALSFVLQPPRRPI